jgi:hypothetical protein
VSVNDKTVERYRQEASELLPFITQDEKGNIVAKNKETGECSQLQEDGLCAIHKNYGERFLPDTCMYYPRIYRAIGDELLISGNTSCPEFMRLALTGVNPHGRVEKEVENIPEKVTDFKYEHEQKEDLFATIEKVLECLADEEKPLEQQIYAFLQVAEVLDKSPSEDWHNLIEASFEKALPLSDKNTNETLLLEKRLLDTFCVLKQGGSMHWLSLIEDCKNMNMDVYAHQRQLYETSLPICFAIDNYLRRYLVAECLRTIFPYAGSQGKNAYEKAVVMVLQTIILRILLIMHIVDQAAPTAPKVVYIAQTMARGMNHFSKNLVDIYKEQGLHTVTELGKII